MNIIPPVIPGDYSCANLANAHNTLMLVSMWMMARSYCAGDIRNAQLFNLAACIHSEVEDMHRYIASVNQPRPTVIVIL